MWFQLTVFLCLAYSAASNELYSYSRQIPGLKINEGGTNSECEEIIKGINKDANDTLWWIKMIDASSRLPSGILAGHIWDYGNFDECLSIEHVKENNDVIIGQYCPRSVKVDVESEVGNLSLILSVCIPSVCKAETFFTYKSGISFLGKNCFTKYSYSIWDWSDITVASVLGVILIFMVLSTIYDVYLHYQQKKSPYLILVAFSVFSNGKKLVAITESPDQITCFNGLRFVSMCWVIAGHRWTSMRAVPMINTLEGLAFMDDTKSAYIQGARVAVDTFFFMSAFLISYGYFKKVEKKVITFKNIPILYFHRLFRITPALAALFFVHVTFIRRIGSGPIWQLAIESTRERCVKWWWSVFLYVQNYVNYDEMCVEPTWYLSADMQMFILAPFLIIPLGYYVRQGKKTTAIGICICLILISMFIPMGVDLARENLNEYETHTRLSIYIIGILMGMVIKDLKASTFRVPPFWNVVIWGIFLAEMLAIIIYTQDVRQFPETLKTNLFHTFSRPLWTIGLSWLVYSCTIGTGGFINWMLSLPTFQIISRLNYSMYLLHNPLITMSIGYARTAFNFSEYEVIYYWCGDLILTTLLAVVWVLAFESPMIIIEKIIFGTGGQGKAKQEPVVAPVSPLAIIETIPQITIPSAPKAEAD